MELMRSTTFMLFIEMDIRSWTSLDDLFNHLEANADGSYSESLGRGGMTLKEVLVRSTCPN